MQQQQQHGLKQTKPKTHQKPLFVGEYEVPTSWASLIALFIMKPKNPGSGNVNPELILMMMTSFMVGQIAISSVLHPLNRRSTQIIIEPDM
jgi:hypothetical protein